jgi:hypothetical protein
VSVCFVSTALNFERKQSQRHSMMSVSAQSLEEAATIASEFVSSEYRYLVLAFSGGPMFPWLTSYPGLDNLPSEVQHLLQEIRHKDLRAQGEGGSL